MRERAPPPPAVPAVIPAQPDAASKKRKAAADSAAEGAAADGPSGGAAAAKKPKGPASSRRGGADAAGGAGPSKVPAAAKIKAAQPKPKKLNKRAMAMTHVFVDEKLGKCRIGWRGDLFRAERSSAHWQWLRVCGPR